MDMNERLFSVSHIKAEAPLYTLFALASFISFILVFKLGILALISAGLLLSATLLLVKTKISGPYFIKIDNQGVRYRTHIFAKPLFLSWDMVDQINFHLYEVNFRLKESNRVINLQTNFIKKEEVEDFIEIIKYYYNQKIKNKNAQEGGL